MTTVHFDPHHGRNVEWECTSCEMLHLHHDTVNGCHCGNRAFRKIVDGKPAGEAVLPDDAFAPSGESIARLEAASRIAGGPLPNIRLD